MPPILPIRLKDFTDRRKKVLRAKKRRAWIVRAPYAALLSVAKLGWIPVEVKRLRVESMTTGAVAPRSYSRPHPVIAPAPTRFHCAPGHEQLRVSWAIVGAEFVTRIRFEVFSTRHAHDDGQSRLLWRRELEWARGNCPATGHIVITGAFDDVVDPEDEDIGPFADDAVLLDDAAFDPHGPTHVLTSRFSPYKLKLSILDPNHTLYLVKPARWAYLEIWAKDDPLTPFSDAPCRKIHAIHVGRSTFPTAACEVYYEQLRPLAAQYGFHVLSGWNVPTENATEWLRDTQIVLDNGGFLLPWSTEDIFEDPSVPPELRTPKNIMNYDLEDRAIAYANGYGDSYVTNERHPDFRRVPNRVASSAAARPARDHATRQNWHWHYGSGNVEGGNILVTTRAHQRPRAIIGDMSLLQTMVTLQWQGRIDPIGGDLLNPDDELAALKDEANRHTVEAALATAAGVIAADLGMDVDDLLFVEQLAFHVDMCMAVGPNDTILVQDHDASHALLEQLAGEAWDPDDVKRLELYLEFAASLGESMRALTGRVVEQLEAAGYDVLPVAAVFTSGPDGQPINFMNHIAGTDDDDRMYYITNAAHGPLGAAIQGRFEQVLLDLGYAAVHFIGTDGAAENSLKNLGALRCLTAVQPYPYRRSDE